MRFSAIGLLLISMFSIQYGASLAKGLFSTLGPEGTTVARLWLSTFILFAVWRPWRERLGRRAILAVFAYGVSLGCMNFLFYLAIARIPLGLAVAIEFTGPLAVAVFSSRRRLDFLWIAFALVGLLLLSPLAPASGGLDVVGVLLALGAGLFWGLYIVFGKELGASVRSGGATALGMLVAALVVSPLGFARAGAELWNPSLLPAALAMALFSSALPYSLEMTALRRIPAKTFGILMSLEPAVAALTGFVFLHESLSTTQGLAIVLIIVASLGTSRSAALAETPASGP